MPPPLLNYATTSTLLPLENALLTYFAITFVFIYVAIPRHYYMLGARHLACCCRAWCHAVSLMPPLPPYHYAEHTPKNTHARRAIIFLNITMKPVLLHIIWHYIMPLRRLMPTIICRHITPLPLIWNGRLHIGIDDVVCRRLSHTLRHCHATTRRSRRPADIHALVIFYHILRESYITRRLILFYQKRTQDRIEEVNRKRHTLSHHDISLSVCLLLLHTPLPYIRQPRHTHYCRHCRYSSHAIIIIRRRHWFYRWRSS